jgi:hypothetical protein
MDSVARWVRRLALVGLLAGAVTVWRNRMISANERTFVQHPGK